MSSVSGVGARINPLIGLAGVLIAALTAEFNDQVLSLTLLDIRGGLGLGADPASWFTSIFAVAQVIGMATAPWWAVTATPRRLGLFVVTLSCVSTVAIPLSDNLVWIYSMRALQGLSVGLTIPMLMMIALRVLGPEIRLVGLACYALTATFSAPFANTLAALWTDVVGDWRFVFLETIPLCTTAAALIWWGVPKEKPKLERLAQFDYIAFVLLLVSAGSLVTVLEQGDRLDWFNSKLISTLTLVAVVSIPAFLWRQWTVQTPFFQLRLLGRRNVAFGVSALIVFLLLALSGTEAPVAFLEQTQGLRPIQAHVVTLEIALLQLLALPAAIILLDRPQVDARLVALAGLLMILAACMLDAFVNPAWNQNQFYIPQALEAFGFAFIIMPILMLVTNVVTADEGPFASALFNTPRAIAEAVGVWMLQLIARTRGAFHRERLADTLGQVQLGLFGRNIGGASPTPGIGPQGGLSLSGRGGAFGQLLDQQIGILTSNDTFLIMATLTLVLGALLFVPERTLPPRIALADH